MVGIKKFELTGEKKTNICGKTLFRIKALISFGGVKAGELGGFVEKEENLDQSGDAWVYGNAEVSGNARVAGNAEVSGNAWVSGDARVYGNAKVSGDAWVYGNAEVADNADYVSIEGFGTEFRGITFFRCKDKTVKVARGCFYGTIEEFRKQVEKTRKGKIAKEYLMMADLMEYHFAESEDEYE